MVLAIHRAQRLKAEANGRALFDAEGHSEAQRNSLGPKVLAGCCKLDRLAPECDRIDIARQLGRYGGICLKTLVFEENLKKTLMMMMMMVLFSSEFFTEAFLANCLATIILICNGDFQKTEGYGRECPRHP